jgi:hypothetical protein
MSFITNFKNCLLFRYAYGKWHFSLYF